jgi:hypothetical protein
VCACTHRPPPPAPHGSLTTQSSLRWPPACPPVAAPRRASRDYQRHARMHIVPYLQAEEDKRFTAVQFRRFQQEEALFPNDRMYKPGQRTYHVGPIHPPPKPPLHSLIRLLFLPRSTRATGSRPSFECGAARWVDDY